MPSVSASEISQRQRPSSCDFICIQDDYYCDGHAAYLPCFLSEYTLIHGSNLTADDI